jgi:hypothetical protein
MNKYAQHAMSHWQRTDPDRFQQIPEPDRERFFQELGEQAERQIQELEDQLAGSDPPQEAYLDKVGRLNAARQQAEEIVLRELILIPEPSKTDPEPTESTMMQDVLKAIENANQDEDLD